MATKQKQTFQYVFIPADPSAPVESRTGDKAGGLTDDELVLSAKQYFFVQSGGAKKAQALKEASPEQRHQLAEQFREAQTGNPMMQKLSDEQILSFVESSQSNPQCEIMALTVPTKGNGYQAVSMYVSESGEGRNDRASNLLEACGHRLPETANKRTPGVYGDVFCGRCHDNEGEDEWRRVDFEPRDMEESSDWMTIAKRQGGGGGSGASNVASLTGTMGQLQSQQQVQQKQEDDLGYTWDQTEDEVEMKMAVPATIKAKDVSIKFARSSLTVKVGGEVLVEGATGGTVVVDESTYTLQDSGEGRELCIIMGKHEEGKTWAQAVNKK
jgi:HSP20 family molecular chaperone IbpA